MDNTTETTFEIIDGWIKSTTVVIRWSQQPTEIELTLDELQSIERSLQMAIEQKTQAEIRKVELEEKLQEIGYEE